MIGVEAYHKLAPEKRTMTQQKIILIALLLLPTPAVAQNHTPTPLDTLVSAAIERTTHEVTYDGTYHRLDYPGGDVPDSIGVCTDVVIRAYRAGLGIDLQERVHEDMTRAFGRYPAAAALAAASLFRVISSPIASIVSVFQYGIISLSYLSSPKCLRISTSK